MAENTTGEASIPVAELIAWQHEQADELDAYSKIYEERKDGLSDLDPNRNFALGAIHGKRESLQAFTAFVIACTGKTLEQILDEDTTD